MYVSDLMNKQYGQYTHPKRRKSLAGHSTVF